MTRRSGWILLLAFTVFTAAVLAGQEPLAVSSLSVILWVGLQWFLFRVRTGNRDRIVLQAQRRVGRMASDRLTAVVDQPLEVECTIQPAPRLSGLRLEVQDVLPGSCQVMAGSASTETSVAAGSPVRLRYTLRSRAIGRSGMPGLRLVIRDRAGLFCAQQFHPLRQELTTLPYQIRPQATVSVLKRRNVQMLLGNHAHRKAGTSMELLGIRPYRAGDPPRWIAWKPTARLGQLMTCEYESEVPVRATILADISSDQFAGRPGPSAADGALSACASIARLLLADRDPVALMLISGGRQRWLPHGLGERQLTRILWQLIDSARGLDSQSWSIEAVAHAAWRCVERRHPELLDDRINPLRLKGVTFRRRARRLRGQREQLSYALAGLFGGPPGLPLRLQVDDRLLRRYAQRILDQAPEAAELPVSPLQATSADTTRRLALETLGRGLLGGVSRASDNELFILISPLPRDRVQGQQLISAVRLARAAFHRVILIDSRSPLGQQPVSDPDARRIFRQQLPDSEPLPGFREALDSLNVKVGHLEDGSWMHKVIAEVDLLRSARARGTGKGAARR